jgi:hypothetical protein
LRPTSEKKDIPADVGQLYLSRFSFSNRVAGLAIRSDATSMTVYGPDYKEVFRTGAALVSKKSKGAKPADLPNEQPTKFQLVITSTLQKRFRSKFR